LIVTQQPQVAVYCSNLLAILKMVATDTIVCRVGIAHQNLDFKIKPVAIVGWVKRQRNPTSHKVGAGFRYLNYTYKL